MSTDENKITMNVNDISGNSQNNNANIDDIPSTTNESVDIDNKEQPINKKGEPQTLTDFYGDYDTISDTSQWFKQVEYVIFKNELKSIRNNNKVVLKECKENKRLLDLKYNDLNNLVNNIQTSVIFCSTISGFIQATRIQFGIPDNTVSVVSIFISTYISLLLSISKYYKFDEMKERIQTLREKFSLLHNQLDHRMDVIGPWGNKDIWIYQDPKKKLLEWAKLHMNLSNEYNEIIENKKSLITEFEIIMDSKTRNTYHIKNRELNYSNRQQLYQWDKKESDLENSQSTVNRRPSSMVLQHEELDNWGHDDSDID